MKFRLSFSNTVQATTEWNGIEKQINNTIAARMAFEAKLDKLLNQDIHDERTQYMLLQTEIEQALLLKQEVQNTVCGEHSLVVSTYQVCSAILMSFDYFF